MKIITFVLISLLQPAWADGPIVETVSFNFDKIKFTLSGDCDRLGDAYHVFNIGTELRAHQQEAPLVQSGTYTESDCEALTTALPFTLTTVLAIGARRTAIGAVPPQVAMLPFQITKGEIDALLTAERSRSVVIGSLISKILDQRMRSLGALKHNGRTSKKWQLQSTMIKSYATSAAGSADDVVVDGVIITGEGF